MKRLLIACAPFVLLVVASVSPAASPPVVAIIIDDLGNNAVADHRAINLPGPVACSFLPHTPYAKKHAALAHRKGKEVLLHLPLEALHHNRLGPGGVTLHMMPREFVDTVRADLASIPNPDGVNNHMGSLMTRNAGDMAWLMTLLSRTDLFFIDSRTTARSVAYEMAVRYGVPAASRDVFLDDVRDKDAIVDQLHRLVSVARKNGSAIAIGHPYPITMAVLKELLPKLAAQGVELVPVKAVIQYQQRVRLAATPQ